MRLTVFIIASYLFTTVANASEVVPANVSLSENDRTLMAWVDSHANAILEELRQHVDLNTGTANIAGLDQYRERLQSDLEQLGFATQTHASAAQAILTCGGGQMQFADHLIARRQGGNGPRLLLNGHMDTVFPHDDEFQKLMVSEDGTLAGPGVADMKGGIVIMLNALRALNAQGLLKDVNLTVLLNSDEEIGSLGSRPLIEELAREHDIGLVFEGSWGNTVTRARKGLGQARLVVRGRESHAGGAHPDGVSANLELAQKIVEIEQLTDYEKQTTVNTGVMRGGEKRNTVAGCADAYIDMRFPDQAAGEQLQKGIKRVAAKQFVHNPNHPELPITEYWSVLHRPVKPADRKVDELIALAMGYSVLIGEPITGTRYSGGGTDGSIAQAVGLPTMDSLGIDGDGAHSSRETATVKSLIARTKLVAVLMAHLLVQSE
ncbi:MAG: M20 family metallopeptidase [Gammaproteobacteria bacterium]|nr:M20 family metallopeptidase [Gammaproteobacteria bacterium]